MLRSNAVCLKAYRPYYNLPTKSDEGRRMTGFMTPYRHWMWKQNELWRNVHEAQFEHLRKVYKRQWLESFRVNADEYIYKYNITKAAQLAQWEHEMQAQEKQRRDNQQMAQGRQSLKKKHLDLLREYHERQFFYWYERASERLQYMTHINYIPQSKINEHIEKELDRYVVGSKEPYPLNFVGQMPMLEDKDGNIAEVPENLMTNYVSENPATPVSEFKPREGTDMAEEQLLRLIASAQEEELAMNADFSAALRETLDEMDTEESALEKEKKVAFSMEQTEEEREVSRRAYIDRGKTGSRSVWRPRYDPVTGDPQAPPADSTPTKRRKTKSDRAHELQRQVDAAARKAAAEAGLTREETTKVGDVGKSTKMSREDLLGRAPTMETLRVTHPEVATTSEPGARIRTQDMFDKKYSRGKYKKKDGDGEDL